MPGVRTLTDLVLRTIDGVIDDALAQPKDL